MTTAGAPFETSAPTPRAVGVMDGDGPSHGGEEHVPARLGHRVRMGVGRLEGATWGRVGNVSIRWRLTIWYTLVVAVMLSAFSLFAYWYMGTSLSQDLHRLSTERADQIQAYFQRSELADPTTGRPMYLFIDRTMDPFRNSGSMVRIFNDQAGFEMGSAVFQDGNEEVIPINRAAIVAALKGMEHAESQPTPTGSFYVYTRPLVATNGQITGVVQILTSRERYEATMTRLGRVFGFGTLFATILALAVGAAMAYTALSPIDAITRTAQQINQRRDLSRRIEATGPQDEVGRLATTVNDMLDRIEAMFERQREFMADVSHELRTPLTTIRGELDLMERSGVLDPEGLEAMMAESDRMARLVNDLLLLARAESGVELRHDRVDIGSLVNEVARQSRTLAGDERKVTLDGIEHLEVIGDRDRLKQLVLILVDNALHHTPPGTTIELGLHHGQAPDTVELVVADDGPGISPEHQARIFDRFYRVDKSRNRTRGSTGLGLAIAQWVVQAHGGSISVSSAPGRGTRFTTTLPEAHSAGGWRPSDAPHGNPRGER